MTSSFPLIIVMGTIVALVVIQRGLSRMDLSGGPAPSSSTPEPKTSGPKSPEPPPAPPKPRGLSLFPGLSVTGLDDRGVERFRGLVKKGDNVALAVFLAGQRPNILELDEYLKETRARFLKSMPQNSDLSDPETIQELLSAFEPDTFPGGLNLDALSAREQLLLLTFNPRSQRLVTRDFMALFGGQAFHENFTYYCKTKKSEAMQIQANHPDRKAMEALAQSEVADKGRHIPLALRLTVLNMDQLRQMCKDLNKEVKFATKQELTEALSQIPGSAVLLSMQYTVDDLFILNPLTISQKDAENEWDYLLAYARLLTKAKSDTGLLNN